MLDSGKSPVVVSSKLNREQQQQQQTKTVRVVRLQTISSELLKKNGRSRNRTFLFLLFFNELKKNFADIKRFEPGPLCCCQLVKIRSRSGIFGRTNQSFFFLFLRFSANCATNKTMRFFPSLSISRFFFLLLSLSS